MANLVAYTSGNLGDSTTWKVTDVTTAGAAGTQQTAHSATTASTTTIVPNATAFALASGTNNIEGVMTFIAKVTSTGTITSHLLQSTTVTISIASPGVITWNNHGLTANQVVLFTTTGALPTGLTAGTNYYVVGSSITTNTFQLSTTSGGAALNTSGTQSGVQSAWVSIASVTINASDLPTDPTFVFFKYGTAISGSGTAIYRLGMQASSAGNVNFYRDATAANWCRLFRNSTTTTPVAADALYMSGEWTTGASPPYASILIGANYTYFYNAGSGAAIVLGSIDIGAGATLSFGSYSAGVVTPASSTQYQTRMAGSLNVWGNGTLNIGTSSSRIPSNSTAVLVIECSTNVLYGLIVNNGATCNIYGAQKDSWTRLDANISVGGTSATLETTNGINGNTCGTSGWLTKTVTITNITTNTCTSVGHGLRNQDCVIINGSTANGITAGTTYIIINADTDTFQLSTTFGGTAATLTNGSGLNISMAAGDDILITSSSSTSGNTSRRSITATTSTTCTFPATTVAHTGTGSYRAEITNLTRNAGVRGQSQTLQSYILVSASGVVNWDNATFACLGSATANKEGITIATTSAGSVLVNNCVIHDFIVASSTAFYFNSATPANLTFTNNTIYRADGPLFNLAVGSAATNSSVSGNLFCRRINTAGTAQVALGNPGIPFTNNAICCSAATAAVGTAALRIIGNATNYQLATHSNNYTHSNTCYNALYSNCAGTVSGLYSFVGVSSGVVIDTQSSSTSGQLKLSNCVLANGINAILITTINNTALNSELVIDTCTFSGNTVGLYLNTALVGTNPIIMYNSTFSSNTSDITIGVASSTTAIYSHNSTFSSVTTISNQSISSDGICSMNHGNVTGVHKQWTSLGIRQTDSTTYNLAAPSELLTPSTTVPSKFTSAVKYVAVASGSSITVSVYVKYSGSYTGSTPRLVLKANPSMGFNTDQYGTGSLNSSSFNALTITTPTASMDGVLEFYVDCDGAAGTVNVDDWTIS